MVLLPTVGDPWQIAVGVPIYNPGFRVPSVVATTLSAAASAGGATLSVADDLREYAVTLSGVGLDCEHLGDVVTVGPSTHADYDGKSETKYISSTTSSSIIATANLSYSYKSGDPVSVGATGVAGGWTLDTTYLDYTPQKTKMQNFTSKYWGVSYGFVSDSSPSAWGYDDEHLAQQFQHTVGMSATNIFLNQNVPNYTAPSPKAYGATSVARYRFGAASMLATQAGNPVSLALYISVNGAIATGSDPGMTLWVTGSNQVAWAMITLAGSATEEPTENGFNIGFNKQGSGSATFRMDSVFAEHVMCLEDYADGFYAFDSMPDLASLVLVPHRAYSLARMQDSAVRMLDPTGEAYRYDRWTLACRMSDVTPDDWHALQILNRWQASGAVLNLHTGLPELPATLQGRMFIPNIGKAFWDLRTRAIDFTFEEM